MIKASIGRNGKTGEVKRDRSPFDPLVCTTCSKFCCTEAEREEQIATVSKHFNIEPT